MARAWSCGARTSAVVCFNWRLARRVCGLVVAIIRLGEVIIL